MTSFYITHSPFLDGICGFHTRRGRRNHVASSRPSKAQRSAADKGTDMNRKQNCENIINMYPVSLPCLENIISYKYEECFVQYCIYKVYYKLQAPRDFTLDRLIKSQWRIDDFNRHHSKNIRSRKVHMF